MDGEVADGGHAGLENRMPFGVGFDSYIIRWKVSEHGLDTGC